MILLLGKNDAVERYAKEILNIDMSNDIVYYPDETTHYSELSRCQRLDMINEFLHSDLDFKVITAIESKGCIKGRVLENKEKAIYVKDILGLELR